jgi:hypothetical protein
LQELETEGQKLSATAVGQETEVADAHEAWGKGVEEKAAQELVHRQGHQALLVGVGGVSPAKGDLVPNQRDEAMVGDGHARGVGAQVVEDILGAAKGRLAIDDPRVAKQGAQEGRESFR